MEKEKLMKNLIVDFKTPIDYFLEAVGGKAENINKFPVIQKTLGWDKYDNDLHIYPFIHAKAGILSMGCRNRCSFCPSAAFHKGKVNFGDPEIILPYYRGENVHFMDEDFFNNDLDIVLPLLKKYHITWLAMTTFLNFQKMLAEYGENYLYECGLRCVEIGLENVVLMKKVTKDVFCKKIAIYYLNMTCLPKETKESIQANAEWMKSRSLENPIHFNNGVWYAPGQYYYPYGKIHTDGEMCLSKKARTRPTYIPNSLLFQDYCVIDLEKVNYYAQLVYGIKLYPKKMAGNIGEFISKDVEKACWMFVGIRTGGII